jgi:hypothetical protein
MRLRNISGSKDDAFEESIAGKTMVGNEKRLPCISEGGAFMSPVEISALSTIHIKCSIPRRMDTFCQQRKYSRHIRCPADHFVGR